MLSFGTDLLPSKSVSKNTKIKMYRILIFPVVFYDCETWSRTLREKHRLRMFENRVLRIFGPNRGEVTGEWRRLHNEVLYGLYFLPNFILVMR